MALSTYAELQTAIGTFLIRDDLTDDAPDLIRLAEAEMQRTLKHWRMEKRSTASISARFSAVPTDFLAPIRMNVTSSGYLDPLQPITPQEMQDLRQARGDATGVPTHYAIINSEFEFCPTPAESYTAELLYRRTLPALSDSNTTNWLLDLAPDAYLYGALKHSTTLLQEPERLAQYGGLYQAALDGIDLEGHYGQYGGPLRMRVMQ